MSNKKKTDAKKECPFKYETQELVLRMTQRRKIGFFKYAEDVIHEERIKNILCKLNHFDCVGEDKCPIMKK